MNALRTPVSFWTRPWSGRQFVERLRQSNLAAFCLAEMFRDVFHWMEADDAMPSLAPSGPRSDTFKDNRKHAIKQNEDSCRTSLDLVERIVVIRTETVSVSKQPMDPQGLLQAAAAGRARAAATSGAEDRS